MIYRSKDRQIQDFLGIANQEIFYICQTDNLGMKEEQEMFLTDQDSDQGNSTDGDRFRVMIPEKWKHTLIR